MSNDYEMKSFVRKLNGENTFKVESDLNKERLTELTAERDKLNAEIEALNNNTVSDLKLKFIEKELSAYGIPLSASKFIDGETPEDIKANVKKFASVCGNQTTTPTYTMPKKTPEAIAKEREQDFRNGLRYMDEQINGYLY